MMKNCGHQDCARRDPAGASYSECFQCGRMACFRFSCLGCFCSEYEIVNPIRDGVGIAIPEKTAEGKWIYIHPYATESAKIVRASLIEYGLREGPYREEPYDDAEASAELRLSAMSCDELGTLGIEALTRY